MKPWDDDLRIGSQGVASALVVASDGRMVAVLRQIDVEEWGPLLLAAPKMAKALLHITRCEVAAGRCRRCMQLAHEALTVAGVMP